MSLDEALNEKSGLGPPEGTEKLEPPKNAAEVLGRVARVLTYLPEWRSGAAQIVNAAAAFEAVGAPTASEAPADSAFSRAVTGAQGLAEIWCPWGAARSIEASDFGEAATNLVGRHSELLTLRLRDAERNWPPHGGETDPEEAHGSGWPEAPADAAAIASQAVLSLDKAMQHAVFLDLCWDVRNARVGERINVTDTVGSWGMSNEQAQEVLAWLKHDPPEFDRERLPHVVDEATRTVYRSADSWWEKLYTTTAALWGAILGFGLLLAVFELLNAAEITSWPSDWFAKFIVLYLFVLGGALLHVASLALSNIRFGDPLQVYVVRPGFDWLRLRWLAILRLFVPIVFVTGSLWGAGNVPATFQDLSVAVLAGYSADSLFRISLSKVEAQAGGQTKEASGVTGPANK